LKGKAEGKVEAREGAVEESGKVWRQRWNKTR
jgi:hypothetical protein